MSWKDRIKEGAITTPDGQRYIFQWEDLERTFEKKTSDYQFSDAEGTLVQDFGLGRIDYPITIYFSGEDYDQTADAFFNSAIQKGISIFESPRYGIKNVVIKGSPQRDSIRSSGNQAIFNLEMTETIIVDVPETAEYVRTSILADQENFIDTNAEIFAAEYDVSGVTDFLKAVNRIQAFVNDLKDTFKNAIATVDEINEAFNEIADYINENIDFLLGAPLQLANSLQRLIKAPARVQQSIESRINGYLDGYNKLLVEIQGGDNADTKNQRQERQLFVTAYLSAMSEIYLFPDTDGIGFLTQADAINAALNLRDKYSEGQEFLDQEEANSIDDKLSNRFNVSDAITQSIKDITSRTAKDLLSLSFSLKQERIFITDKWYNILDLCYKLYGTTENDTLDFLISTNGLTDETIIKVPKNTSIKYYV